MNANAHVVMWVVILACCMRQTQSGFLGALQMSPTNDLSSVTLTFKGDHYQFNMFNQYLSTINYYYLCYRPIGVSYDPSNGASCDLTGQNGSFNCILLNKINQNSATVNQNFNLTGYFASSDLSSFSIDKTKNESNDYLPNYSSAVQFFFTVPTLNANSIYELRTGETASFSSDSNQKINYFHTYRVGTITSGLDVIAQRNTLCTAYTDENTNVIITVLFYGGIIRGTTNYMMQGFLTFYKDNLENNVNMWGGLAYSKDHGSGRDMVAFSSQKGVAIDLASLYLRAPFEDTSSNIGGTLDYVVSHYSASFDPYVLTNSSYYMYYNFMQMYRLYDTLDSVGDEVIIDKINNQYCYLGYYTNSKKTPSPTSDKHNVINCFQPVTSAFDSHFHLLVFLLLFAII